MRRRISPRFLKWAKSGGGQCCLCSSQAADLHHYQKAGMGTKCDDYFVCRVCRPCHQSVQGKYQIALERLGKYWIWSAMVGDNMDLLADYSTYLEGKTNDDDEVF